MTRNKKIALGIFVFAFLVMSVVPVCGQSDFGSSDVHQDDFSFYAVYDRLVDLNSFDSTHAAMSGDGNKLIYSGRDKTSNKYTVYTVNTDGTGLTQIALPDLEGAGIEELAIDQDGSRAFFMVKYYGPIYKVENGVATKIFDTDDYPDIGEGLSQIQTTADGGYVYFRDFVPNDHDVWRVAHSGGSPELIIDDYLVPHDSGPGFSVTEFAISDDGNAIAFTLYGYRDHDYFGIDSYKAKRELFVRDSGGYRQLTNDDDNVEKSYLAISGDGSTIVFYARSPQHKWYSLKSDGSAKIAVDEGGISYAGPVLNYDGTKMFYADKTGNCGRLANTDGSGGIDLLPEFPIQITADCDLCISDNGHRISFQKSYTDVYVGYLNDPDAVPDAPVIESIAFDPPAMPRGDPDAVIVLTSEISDPQGLADIKRTSTDELVDGRLEHYDNIPVSFTHAANDDGWSHDETAGDGIFSTAGKPAPKIDELDQMTVRMGVKDDSGSVVVADTVLFIGEVPPTPTPPSISLGEAVDNTALSWTTYGGADWFGQEDTYYHDGDAAESGDIGDDGVTCISTTVSGPGTLNFYWQVSSESGFDFLEFYLDDVLQDHISGDSSWVQETYSIDSGTHTLKWCYIKNTNVSSGADCGWLDKVEFSAATPSPPSISLGEAVDNTALSWTTYGVEEADWFGQEDTYYHDGDAAESGDIGDDGISCISTTVSGPGTLNFYWQVSSEMGFDFLEFYLDDVLQDHISGDSSWVQETYSIDSGTHTLKWCYIKDTNVSSGADCGWLDKVEFSAATPSPPSISLGEAVDNTALSWTTYGDADWFGQEDTYYHDGDAAESGDIGDDEMSCISTTVSGPGTLNFYWQVSSETGFDFLEFYLDDVLQDFISGDISWVQETYSIDSGTHTLEWCYIKDTNVSSGADCGWLDKVEFSAATPSPPSISLGEAVDNTALSWTTYGVYGEADWFGQEDTYYHDGDAAESGDIGDDEISCISTVEAVPQLSNNDR